MDQKLKQVVGILFLMTVMFTVWMFFGGPFDTYYLLWNLFLAWIPLILSLLFLKEGKKASSTLGFLGKGILGAGWLFFFPNAVYVITDFIHLSQDVFYYENPFYEPYSGKERILYSMEALSWNNFYSITLAVFLACALSTLSLFLLHRTVRKKWGALSGWGFVLLTHLLTGYAMYLGRFIRFNSWDVLAKPLSLLLFVLDNLHAEAFSFTLHFFLLSLCIYVLFYLFLHLGKEEPQP